MALQEAQVEGQVVTEQGQITDEVDQLRQDAQQARRPGQHGIADSGELGDVGWQRTTGIDQGRPLGFHSRPPKSHRPDLDDRVLRRIQAGRFEIDGDDGLHGRRGL